MSQRAETAMSLLPWFGDRPHIFHSSSKQPTHILGAVVQMENESVLA